MQGIDLEPRIPRQEYERVREHLANTMIAQMRRGEAQLYDFIILSWSSGTSRRATAPPLLVSKPTKT